MSVGPKERYAGLEDKQAKQMLDGSMGIEDIAAHVLHNEVNPLPRSGAQEKLENIVYRYI